MIAVNLLQQTLGFDESRGAGSLDFSRPRVSRRSCSDVRSFFSVEDLDRLLTITGLRPPYVSFSRPSDATPKHYTLTPDATVRCSRPGLLIHEFLTHGTTLVFQHLQLTHPVIRAFVRSLSFYLAPLSVQCNAYLAPPHALGVPPHADEHHTLLLQLLGRKKWKIWCAAATANVPSSIRPTDAPLWIAHNTDSLDDFVLDAGDAVLIPQGFVHTPVTEEDFSLHLTLGISERSVRALAETAYRALHNRLPDINVPSLRSVPDILEHDALLGALQFDHVEVLK